VGVVLSAAAGSEIVRVQNSADLELVDIEIAGSANRRCVYVTGSGSSVLLDGVEVSACKQPIDGAAIRLESGTSATILYSALLDNGAGSNSGGHLYAASATSLTVTSTLVSGGRADSAAAFRLVSTPTVLDDVTFDDNVADSGDGGSVWADNTNLTVLGGTFGPGTASGDGGCIATSGTQSLTVNGTLFDGCGANSNGGAIAHKSTGALSVDASTFSLPTADLNHDNIGNGGGIYSSIAATLCEASWKSSSSCAWSSWLRSWKVSARSYSRRAASGSSRGVGTS
jgi:hypothetical protein